MIYILFKELKYRCLEYFLGIITAAIVVAVFIIQYSVSKSAENEIHTAAHNLGSNMLVVPEDTDMADFYSSRFYGPLMPENYLQLALDSEAGKYIRLQQPVLYGNLNQGGLTAVIIGKDSADRNHGDSAIKTPEAVVTRKLADRLGIREGSTYTAAGNMFIVNSIIESDAMTSDYGVIISLKDAQRVLNKPGMISALYLGGCWCSIDVPALGRMIEGSLPGTRAVTFAGMISAQKGAVSVMRKYTDIFYIAAILLVTAAILLLIFSQIRRYKREFGLLMALGASGETIRFNLWTKSFITGVAGGIAGFLISIPLSGLLGRTFPELGQIPLTAQIIPVSGIIILSCLIGAVIPAYTIFEIDPVETLREE